MSDNDKETVEDNDVDTSDDNDTDTDDTSDDDQGDTDNDTSDDSSDDDELADVDVEDGKKQLTKYFADPKSIPAELRPHFKALQATFTKKMQAAAAATKHATIVAKKAEALDVLTNDAEFIKWMDARQKGLLGKKGNNRSVANDDDDDDETPLTRKQLAQMLEERDNKREEQRRRQSATEAFEAEKKQFKKDNPDWQLYSDDIDAMINDNPRLPLQDAYDLLKARERKKNGKAALIKAKKNANSQKPSSSGGKEPEKKGKMSFLEAADLARKQLTNRLKGK